MNPFRPRNVFTRLLAGAVACGFALAFAPATAAEQPNFVVIFADDK
jgi:hypothetical protein